jgi:hypothetical protein
VWCSATTARMPNPTSLWLAAVTSVAGACRKRKNQF